MSSNIVNPIIGFPLTKQEKDRIKTLGQRYIKSADPTVNDDSGEGYAVWDKWLNTVSGEAYVCLDATEGAADWQNMSLDADDLADLFGAKADKAVPATAKNLAGLVGTTGQLEDSGITPAIAADQFTLAGGTGTARTLTVDETKALSAKADKLFTTTTKATTGTLAAAEMDGRAINNRAQADDCIITIDSAAEGRSFTVMLSTTVANFYRLVPNGNDKILLDGNPGANGAYVQIASCVQGATIQFIAFESATGVYDWLALSGPGSWQAE